MRLVAFGCSLTFGYALPDTGDNWKSNPSRFAWPKKLANHLNITTVVNRGLPGASNKKILFEIQNFNFQKDDIVFILWSHIERWSVIKSKKIDHYAPHIDTKASRQYYKHIYDEHDHLISYYTRANFAKMMLDNKGIKNFHLTVKPYDDLDIKWNNVICLKTSLDNDIRKQIHNYARDGHHPGVLSHQKFADMIYDEIKKDANDKN